MSKIFLSHSSTDKPFARKLAADLRNYSHIVWIDEAEINIGDSLIAKIREGIDNVDYVAAILSKTSIESEWVKKELEIASNREIEEKKVIVLPILIEKVELPGFLKGKLYGDFTDEKQYDEKLKLLLRRLKDSKLINLGDIEERRLLQKELEEAKKEIKKHQKEISIITKYNLSTKSAKLKQAIERENKKHPEFAPINNVYSFEIGDVNVTIGYLLHVISKSKFRGGHPFEVLASLYDKWPEVDRMIEAYSDMVNLPDND